MEKKIYHVITISGDSGEDSKQDARTLSEAIKFAKEWISDTYYDEVKIFRNGEIKRHYMRLRNGKVVNLLTIKYGDKRLQATETPQISTQTAEVENVSAEGENTAERADIDKRTIEYYVEKYGNLHNLHIAYDEAMEAVRDELFEYRMTPRKGGRYRAERMAELQRKLDALSIEFMQIHRAMAQYLKENAPTQPETPPGKDLSTGTEKTPQSANKRANPTCQKSLHVRKSRTTENASFSRPHENDCRAGGDKQNDKQTAANTQLIGGP